MAIEKRQGKNGTSYRFIVYAYTDQDGRKVYRKKTYTPIATAPRKIEKEVAAAHAQFEKEVKAGTYFNENISFRDFYNMWLETYGKKELTPATYEMNESTVSRVWLPVLGFMPLNQIKGIHIQNVINDLEKQGLKPKTIQKYFSAVSAVFTRAYKLELIESNPARRVTLPRNEKENEIHAFTVEQAERFLQACADGITIRHPEKMRKNGRIIPAYDEKIMIPLQFRVYFTLAIYSGFRRGEMLALQWKDINFKKWLITINKSTSSAKSEHGQFIKDPKTKAGNRTIMLPGICFELLEQWKAEQDQAALTLGDYWKGSADPEERFIFIQDDGSQMDLCTPNRKFTDLIKMYNSGVQDPDKLPEIHLHDLRHTSASILISAGVDIATVARRLGHSKISVTLNTYTHALPDIDQTAADALEKAFSAAAVSVKKDPDPEDLGIFWEDKLRNIPKNKKKTGNIKLS